jgi:pimeloyl-ACP methyl ester carboxylesterase
VYALDMIGFGRSSRPKQRFKTPEQSEDFFLRYFEAWRQAMRLDRFTLIGVATPPN